MYEAYFELSRRPFRSTPDPEFYFPASTHESALAQLRCCLRDGEGIGVLVAGPGTGKTLLCQMLRDNVSRRDDAIVVRNLHESTPLALLQAIACEQAIFYPRISETELRLAISARVLERMREGARTVLLVDEAQHLSPAQFEELRLLTNLEGRKQKGLQVFLFGQAGLARTLDEKPMAAFRQRLVARATLEPLDIEQTVEYVRTRTARAGGLADAIFSADSLSELCDRSEGIPRRINQLAHRALLLAYAHQDGSIDSTHVSTAAEQLRLPFDEAEPRPIELHLAQPKGPISMRQRPGSESASRSSPASEQHHMPPPSFAAEPAVVEF